MANVKKGMGFEAAQKKMANKGYGLGRAGAMLAARKASPAVKSASPNRMNIRSAAPAGMSGMANRTNIRSAAPAGMSGMANRMNIRNIKKPRMK